MASSNLTIRITAHNASQKVLDETTGGLHRLTSAVLAPTHALGGLMSGLGSIGLAGLGVKAAFDVVSGAVQGLMGDAIEAEKGQAALGAVLKSTGGAAGMTADAVNDLANSLSLVTPFEDDAILGGQNLLLTFTNIGKDVFPDATEAMLNMSQALGQDLKSSATQLGKALNDPITGATALRRVGVALTEQQQDQIKAFQESGDLLSAQKIILAELSTEFGGAARAAGETFAGKMKILETQVGNVKEAIGGPLIGVLSGLMTNLTPVIAAFATGLPGAIDGVMSRLQPFLALIGQVIQYLNPSNTYDLMGALFGPEIGPRIDEVVRGIGSVAGVVASFVETIAKGDWDFLRELASEWLGGIDIAAPFDALNKVWTNLQPTAKRIGELFDDVKKAVAALVPEPMKELIDEVVSWTGKTIAAFKPMDNLTGAVNAFSGVIEDASRFVRDHRGAQAVLVGILGAAATAYVLATAVAAAHAIATGVLTVATNAMSVAQGILNAVMTANPIGLVIIAVAGLAAGLVYLYQTSETFRDTVDGVFSFLKRTVTTILDELGGSVRAWGFVLDTVRDGIGVAVDGIAGFFSDLPGRLSNLADGIGGAAASIGNAIRDGIVGGIRGTMGVIGDLGDQLLSALKSLVNSAVDAINDSIPDDIGFDVLGNWVGIDLPDNPLSHLARGTSFFKGGLALLGENGPELAALPRGSRVWSAGQTAGMLASGGGGGGGIVWTGNVVVQGSVIAERDLAATVREELLRIGRRNVSALGEFA